MATVPLGISINVAGAAKAIGQLGRVATSARSIGAGAVAAGTIIGHAFLRGIKVVQQYSLGALKSASDMAKAARAGAQIPAAISDSGLAAAESITAQFTAVKETIFAAFVNALPYVQLFIGAAVAQFQFLAGVISDVAANFGPLFSESLDGVSRNFATLMRWLQDNWRDVAYNIGQAWISAWIAQIETTKRLFTALKGFVTGQGWNFEGAVGLMENANFRAIEGPQFETLALTNAIREAASVRGVERDAAIERVAKQFADTMAAQVRGSGGTSAAQAGNAKTLAEAIVRGSSEDVTTLARMRVGQDQLSVERQQLAAQRESNDYLRRMAIGGQQFEELVLS